MLSRVLDFPAMAILALLLLASLCACGGGGGDDGVSLAADGSHPDIALRDEFGAVIMAGSSVPYSPRQTCGTCHDVDLISSGYHFQQGRLDETGTVQTTDDFYQDGRAFVRSDGMYGKW